MAYIDKISVNGSERDLRDAGAARFDETQALTDAQKQAARANMGAASAADVTALETTIVKTPKGVELYLTTESCPYASLEAIPANTMTAFTAAVFNTFPDRPFTADSFVFVETFTSRPNGTTKNGAIQRATATESNAFATRGYMDGHYGAWVQYAAASTVSNLAAQVARAPKGVDLYTQSSNPYSSLADIPANTIIALYADAFNAMADRPYDVSSFVFVETITSRSDGATKNGAIQRVTPTDGQAQSIRAYWNNTYGNWIRYATAASVTNISNSLAALDASVAKSSGAVDDISTYASLDAFPKNTLLGVSRDAFNAMEGKPFTTDTGVFVETISPSTASMNGGIQRIINWTGTVMAVRAYAGNAYRSWVRYASMPDLAAVEAQLVYSPRSVKNYFDGTYTSLADLPNNTLVGFGKVAVNGDNTVDPPIPGLSDRPFDVNDGIFVETFSTLYNNKSGTVQRVTGWDGSFVAERVYAGGWRAWKVFRPDPIYEIIIVSTSAELIEAILTTMNSGLAGEYHRYTIEIAAGTYDLSSVADRVIAGTLDEAGLFVMPYVTIRGAGKDRTILSFDYQGTDDNVRSLVSALNMPYQSTLEDLTITVRNIRYPVHCSNPLEGQALSNQNPLLVGNRIVLRNVRLIHQGFESGKSATYKVPCAWGSGLWDGSDLEFINCDFYSKQHSAWLNHDHTDNTKDANVRFIDCTLHSDNGAYDGTVTASGNNACALISWGGAAKTHISFENTMIIPSLGMKLNSASVQAQCYDVKADTDIVVVEDKTNNAHTAKTYRVAGCVEGRYTPAAGVVAYTPVSMERLHLVRSYASSLPRHGIALNSAAQTEMVIVQTRGLVSLVMLGATGFALGDKLGWNGSAWVVDATNPLLKVIDNGLTGMFI